MRIAIHIQRLPMYVAGPAQSEMQHTGGHGGIADLIDKNEAAELAALLIRFEHQRLVDGKVCNADGIQAQSLGGEMLQGIDVDLVFGTVDGRGDKLRGELQPKRTARKKRLIRHPNK